MTPRIPRTVTAVILLAGLMAASAGCGWRKNASRLEAKQEKVRVQEEKIPETTAMPGNRPEAGSTELSPDADTPAESSDRLPTDDLPQGPPLPGKIAYLTFDDGPSGHTDRILDILKRNGVKATFFVIGQDSDRLAYLYRRIVEEGHRLGNHTYSHDYAKLYRDPDVFMQDVRKLETFLLQTVGQKPDILRFPGGSNTRLGKRKGQAWLMPRMVKRVKAEGYQYFDWNVSSTDAAQAVQPKGDIVSAVLSAAQGKEQIIVLMHDITAKTTTVEALPEVIRGLKRQGFRFEALTQKSFTTQFLQ